MASTAEGAKEERALWTIAVVGGAAAVAALPLSLAIPDAVVLVLAVPLTLATVGRLRRQRRFEHVALGVLVVSIAGLAFGIGEALVGVLMAGSVAALYLVGSLLLQRDRRAGGVWLVSASVALIAGFASARVSAQGTVALVMVVVGIGVVLTLARLRRG